MFKNNGLFQETISMYRAEKTFFANICIASFPYQTLSDTAINFLHPDEFQYYKDLSQERRKYSYLLGRYCAKKVLAREPFKLRPTYSFIKPGIFNQPIIISPDNCNVQVCMSHCNTLGAAIAYPEEHPMGIDIEPINNKNVLLLKEQMTMDEMNTISSFIEDKSHYLTLLWTVKEALSKVIKTGLMIPFKILEVSTMSFDNECFYSKFKNFHQYKASSFILEDTFISIVYPEKTKIHLNLNDIKNSLLDENVLKTHI